MPQFAQAASWRFYDANLQPVGRLDAPEVSGNSFSIGLLQAGRFVSPDEVIIQGADGSNLHLYYYNRRSGEFRTVSTQPGSYGQPLATRPQPPTDPIRIARTVRHMSCTDKTGMAVGGRRGATGTPS
ncbi:hypothetical protein HC891_01765 [Candidatus Gracilibacteria bacterium]|nr:hypothetical protein [Candidatus Gracilibacteria bacterium]